MVNDTSTPLGQTRTVLAGPLERLLIAPNRVNYHLEHHLIMTVPHYKLPAMHRLLRERGVLDHACVAPGYLSVLQKVVQRAPDRDGVLRPRRAVTAKPPRCRRWPALRRRRAAR